MYQCSAKEPFKPKHERLRQRMAQQEEPMAAWKTSTDQCRRHFVKELGMLVFLFST